MEKKKLQELFSQMTREEKLGQLTQTTGEHFVAEDYSDELVETGPSMEDLGFLGFKEENIYKVGSVLGVSGAVAVNAVQRNYLAKSRLKIPLLFMHDAIHGYRTIFPIPLALASSFDPETVQRVGQLTAQELRAAGIHVDFSPMTDLVRDARWGRVMESFGEDALLSGRLGAAMIEGYQNSSDDGKITDAGVVACLKHFIAYGAPDAGRDYASVDMSGKELFGFYIKPYKQALTAKPRMVMSSFNSLNGEPVTGSYHFLTDILRKRLGFDGLIISDWGAVTELKNHGVAATDDEAGLLALSAGVDIEMVSNSYLRFGEKYIKKNSDLARQVDEAVWKVLQLKNELKLFEAPYVDEQKETIIIRNKQHLNEAKAIAKSSCVLLKNSDKILPLSKRERILIIGPFAKTQELLGNWNCKGRVSETISVEMGFKASAEQVYAYERLEEVPREMLKITDKVIVTIGESWEKSGEGHSSVNLELPVAQQELIHSLKKQGKKIIALGFAGRPLALESVIDEIDALLWTWYLGNEAGSAIAELIFGEGTPTGRLPMSFPRVNGQVPLRYNELRSGRPANNSSYSSRYQDLDIGALFRFGFGLTYADVSYENYQISSQTISDKQSVLLSFDLKNKSNFDTKEVVILYMEDPISKIVRPVREVIDFKSVKLAKIEKKSLSFRITTGDLAYMNNQGEKTLENGLIRLYINDLDVPIFEIEVEN